MNDTESPLPNLHHTQEEVQKIALIEERLQVDVRQVETGSVQLHKKIVAEEVTQQVPVVSEAIRIEHKPVNQYVENLPAVRVEGDTTIISVVKEVLVVEKRLLLVEEIHLTSIKTETIATVTETLRKEVVTITAVVQQKTIQ